MFQNSAYFIRFSIMAFIIGSECDKILDTLEEDQKVKVAKNLLCNSFPSAAVVVLSNVVVLKAGWTGIEQIE